MFRKQLPALLVAVALAGGNLAVCAGWMATPEARMACCSKSGACPMRDARAHPTTPAPAVSQADADRCCASSEPADAAPLATTILLPLSLAAASTPLTFIAPPAIPLPGISRTLPPAPGSQLPKHLLLSVLLV
jgi:hypothetical protein